MHNLAHSRSLHSGSPSSIGQHVLVSCAVQNRKPVFTDLYAGRKLVLEMKRLHDCGAVHSLAWVVMPDYMHWLFELRSESLAPLIHTLKGRSSFAINKAYGRGTLTWQPRYYDHGLRDDEDLKAMAHYVITNPIRAGLVLFEGDYSLWDSKWV